MRKLLKLALVPSLLVTPAAAQIAPEPTKPAVAQDQPVAATKPGPDLPQSDRHSVRKLEEQLRNLLADAGLTDIELMPLSYAVRAKDADGNPVLLMLSPGTQSEWQLDLQDGQDESPISPPSHQGI